jgi:hypothetical protein
MNQVNYIVYDTATFKVLYTSSTYDRETHLKTCVSIFDSAKRPGVDYINVTHPRSKAILAKINEVNGTSF